MLILPKGELGLWVLGIYWKSVFQKQRKGRHLACEISIRYQHLWKSVGTSEIGERDKSNCKAGRTDLGQPHQKF